MKKQSGKNVFVALSGGVDSSVAAALLKKEGYAVTGIYMKEWVPPSIECTAGDDRIMAARAAARLEIPFQVWDFSEEYRKEVADYMLREYAAGRTPNPDIMCNKHIKFGVFLQRALAEGADFIATGHYVIKHEAYSMEHATLYTAEDKNKDQSYFLWTLTQNELRHCLFPIGNYAKPEVRKLAKKSNLPTWNKKDSQGVCFIGQFDFGAFLRLNIKRRTGNLVTLDGEVLGTHDGAEFATIGQRSHIMEHGAHSIKHKVWNTPVYVVEKNLKTNTLIVASEDNPALYKKEFSVSDTNWISGKEPELPLECLVRIRYRQPLQKALVKKAPGSRRHTVQCFYPQRAVASGQSAVFYTRNGKMFGGGIIETQI